MIETVNLEQPVLELGEHIISRAIKSDAGVYWPVKARMDHLGRVWNNHFSIYNGNTGIDSFLLELYKRTGDVRYLKTIDANNHWLLKKSEEHPTNNFSFYHGQMGLAFLNLALFEYTSNDIYLAKALGIARKCVKSQYLNSSALKNSFFDGIAGTLFVFVQISTHSTEPWIEQYIEALLAKLVSAVNLAKPYFLDIPSHTESFRYGPYGIGWTLFNAGDYFNNAALKELGNEICCSPLYRSEDGQGGHSQIVAKGEYPVSPGMVLLNTSCPDYDVKKFHPLKIELSKDDLDQGSSAQVDTVYNCAKSGIANLQYYVFTKEKKYLDQAKNIKTCILDGFREWNLNLDDCSLIGGWSGVGYFLALCDDDFDKWQNKKYGEDKVSFADGKRNADSILFTTPSKLKYLVCKNQFQSSVEQLKLHCPNSLTKVCNSDYSKLKRLLLQELINCQLSQIKSSYTDNPTFTSRKEIEKFNLASLGYSANEEATQHALLQPFIESETPFLNTAFKIPKCVRVVSADEVLDLSRKFDRASFAAFWNTYGERTCLLVRSGNESVEEYSPGLYKLILDQFAVANSIVAVRKRLVDFFLCQDADVLDVLKSATESESTDQLRESLEISVVNKIYEFIIDGIIAPVSN